MAYRADSRDDSRCRGDARTANLRGRGKAQERSRSPLQWRSGNGREDYDDRDHGYRQNERSRGNYQVREEYEQWSRDDRGKEYASRPSDRYRDDSRQPRPQEPSHWREEPPERARGVTRHRAPEVRRDDSRAPDDDGYQRQHAASRREADRYRGREPSWEGDRRDRTRRAGDDKYDRYDKDRANDNRDWDGRGDDDRWNRDRRGGEDRQDRERHVGDRRGGDDRREDRERPVRERQGASARDPPRHAESRREPEQHGDRGRERDAAASRKGEERTRDNGRRSDKDRRETTSGREEARREKDRTAGGAKVSPARRQEAPPSDNKDAKNGESKSGTENGSEVSIKPIWKCDSCGTENFGTLVECTKCGLRKSDADLRFVHVWNLPPDVAKKPLQWFQKKCGGTTAAHTPSEFRPVMQAPTDNESQPTVTVVLEVKTLPGAEALVAAVEKWKYGIPKMKAKLMSRAESDELIDGATTCTVFVKNLPEDIEDEDDIKAMAKGIKTASIGHHETHGRYAIVEAKDRAGAQSAVALFNIPHAGGIMTAELVTQSQRDLILKGSKKETKRGSQRSASRRRDRNTRRSRSRRR